MDGQVMNVGILGTARVVPYALIEPAKRIREVTVAAVASRELRSAQRFAALYGIPRAFSSYDAMLEDEEIDAVYVALPTALHPAWTLRALERGKHVLCEKPLAPNAMLAQEMVMAARKRGLVLQEGMHMLYREDLRRQREIITSGLFGHVVHVVCICRHPNIEMIDNDFRLQYELGGGAALDLGCYAVACLTYITGENAAMVTDVRVQRFAPEVDSWMQAHLTFPSGVTGIVECGFLGNYSPDGSISVECEQGLIGLSEEGLVCVTPERTVRESIPSTPTYVRQLEAFTGQVRGESCHALPLEHSMTTARILDAMYEGAGLAPRTAWRGSL
jgi:predicted dehydrogenase